MKMRKSAPSGMKRIGIHHQDPILVAGMDTRSHGPLTRRPQSDIKGQKMFLGGVIAHRMRGACTIMQQGIDVARHQLLIEPLTENCHPIRRRSVQGIVIAEQFPQIMRSGARPKDEHILLCQRRECAADCVMPLRPRLRIDRKLHNRNIRLRPHQQQGHPSAMIITAPLFQARLKTGLLE